MLKKPYSTRVFFVPVENMQGIIIALETRFPEVYFFKDNILAKIGFRLTTNVIINAKVESYIEKCGGIRI